MSCSSAKKAIVSACLLVLVMFSSPALGQSPCPQCGQIHQVGTIARVAGLPGQAIAQARANHLARVGRVFHPPKSVGDWTQVGNFEGTGGTSRPGTPKEQIPTCRPSGPSGAAPDQSRVLVGDAVAYSDRGSYRVRIWGPTTGTAPARTAAPIKRITQPIQRLRFNRR